MKKAIGILFSLIIAACCLAQVSNNKTVLVQIHHSIDGQDSIGFIHFYYRYIEALGGDSVSYNKDGSLKEGWHEDYYSSGKLLHRGFYSKGKLITFKNYVESGSCICKLESDDPLHCLMETYFENGQPENRILYYKGKAQKSFTFYENGQPKTAEENDKDVIYVTKKKSWYENGQLKSELLLSDLKSKKYNEKSFYNNGKLKEEGVTILLSGTRIYVKDGSWFSYDDAGIRKKAEKYVKGIPVNSKQ